MKYGKTLDWGDEVATIVFLNESEQSVTIVNGTNVQIISWTSIEDIASELINKEVFYVTGAEMVPGLSVIELLSQVTGIDINTKDIVAKSSLKYLHSTGSNKLVCRGKKGDLIFDGPTDIKLISDLPADIFSTNENLQKCVDLGKILIINGSTRKQIISHYGKQKIKTKNAKDASINSILINSSIDDFFEKQDEDTSDAISIDVSGKASFKHNDQEVYSNLKKLGINTDSE